MNSVGKMVLLHKYLMLQTLKT